MFALQHLGLSNFSTISEPSLNSVCSWRYRIYTLLLVSLASLGIALWGPETTAAEQRLTVYTEQTDLDSRLVITESELQVQGHATDLVREVLAEAGFEADITLLPWPRVMNSLLNGSNVLGFSMTRTPSRENRFHWIGLIRPVQFQLWGLRERADELPHSLEQARDLRVSSLRNDVVTEYLLNQGFSNLVYVRESSNTWTMLQRNRIDLIPHVELGIEEYLARHGQPADALVPVISLDEISTGHYLVMSRDSDPELVDALQSAFQSLVARGEHAEILGSTLLR